MSLLSYVVSFCFFFNDTSTTEIYTLSLHDALPIFGGDYTERAFRSLAWKGRHLVIGYAEGSIPKLPVNLSLLKGAALVGVDARQFGEYEREQAAENIAALIKLVVEGKIDPPIAKTFGLDGCKEAFDFFESGTQLGRVVLTISQ